MLVAMLRAIVPFASFAAIVADTGVGFQRQVGSQLEFGAGARPKFLESLGGTAEGPERKLKSKWQKSGSKSVLGGFFAGIFICCLIPPCLWNNERIAIKQAKLQGKARHASVMIEDVNVPPMDELEGHIVFASGATVVDETLKDKYYPSVVAKNCVKLRRVVEMYQWVETEHEKEEGGVKKKKYTWKEAWKDSEQKCPHDDSNTHKNGPMPLPSSKRSEKAYQAWAAMTNGNGDPCAEAAKVNFGVYYCGEYVRRELTNWKDSSVNDLGSCTNNEIGKIGKPTLSTMNEHAWWLYKRQNDVTIGDVRVRFEQLECGPLSVCGVLAKTETGFTFVPLVHEEGGLGESLAQEFGCDDDCFPCVGTDTLYFRSSSAQDPEFIDKLNKLGMELSTQERNAFTRLKSSAALDSYGAAPEEGDLCCTCCIPQNKLLELMHFIGLEEEFLGVQEKSVSHKIMMGEEKKAADRRHNACRLFGVIMGCVAADLLISPITNFLSSHWLLWIMGGGLISCALCLVSCIISLLCTTGIISAAWIRHRPRMVFVLLTVTLLSCGATFKLMHSAAGPDPATSNLPAGAQLQGQTTQPQKTGPAMAGTLAAVCSTYTAACPLGHLKLAAETKCAKSQCNWSDCCVQAPAQRLLARQMPTKKDA